MCCCQTHISYLPTQVLSACLNSSGMHTAGRQTAEHHAHLRLSPCWLPSPAAVLVVSAMPFIAAALSAVTKHCCQRLSA